MDQNSIILYSVISVAFFIIVLLIMLAFDGFAVIAELFRYVCKRLRKMKSSSSKHDDPDWVPFRKLSPRTFPAQLQEVKPAPAFVISPPREVQPQPAFVSPVGLRVSAPVPQMTALVPSQVQVRDPETGNKSGESRRRMSTIIGEELGQLDPSHYSDADVNTSNLHRLGAVCLSAQFFGREGRLSVTVVKGAFLVTSKPKASGKYRIKVQLLHPRESYGLGYNLSRSCSSLDQEFMTKRFAPGKLEYTTQQVRAFRSPQFQEIFHFPLNSKFYPSAELSVTLMDRDVTIGIFRVSLVAMHLLRVGEPVQNIWKSLEPPNKMTASVKGEVEISLCCQPRDSMLSLTIGVLRCKDLPISIKSGIVRVRLILLLCNEVQKSLELQAIQQIPSNGVAEFSVSPTSLMTTYIGPHLLDKVCIILYVLTKSNKFMAPTEMIGQCVIGPASCADQEGLKHWSDATREQGMEKKRYHRLS